MNIDYNINRSQQHFNPDETINLNCQVGGSFAKINLAQKINLKNHAARKNQNKGLKIQQKGKRKKKLSQKQLLNKTQPLNSTNLNIQNKSTNHQLPSQMANQHEPNSHPPFSNLQPLQNYGAKQHETQDLISKNNLLQQNQIEKQNQTNQTKMNKLVSELENQIINNFAQVQNARQYKISVVGSDFVSMRYQCFCSRQYFTYCSIYNHLQKEHKEFLEKNRRFSFTNIYQTNHPVYGYRIKKIMRERLRCPRGQKKNQVQRLTNHAKEKIKAQSQQIQQLLGKLEFAEKQRKEQFQMLKLMQRKMVKASKLISQYQTMIFGFQNIFEVLNIKQITRKLNSGPTVLKEDQSNQQEVDQLLQ